MGKFTTKSSFFQLRNICNLQAKSTDHYISDASSEGGGSLTSIEDRGLTTNNMNRTEVDLLP